MKKCLVLVAFLFINLPSQGFAQSLFDKKVQSKVKKAEEKNTKEEIKDQTIILRNKGKKSITGRLKSGRSKIVDRVKDKAKDQWDKNRPNIKFNSTWEKDRKSVV